MVAADTLAMVLFSILTFFIASFWEMTLAGLTLKESAMMRGAGGAVTVPARYLLARFQGMLADFCERNVPMAKESVVMKAVANGLAVWTYQVPLYLTGALIVGISWKQVLIVQCIFLIESPFVGYIYRKILDKTRARLASQS